MARVKQIEKGNSGNSPDFFFHCPGCKIDHGVWTTETNLNKAIWEFNGDMYLPTFRPSIRVRWGIDVICHSFVTGGKIRFLEDSTHWLAGQTVDLPELD